MKYPIDPVTAETFYGHLVAHDRAQRQLILALTTLLREAMDEHGDDSMDWYNEAAAVMKMQSKIKVENENRLFNAKNGHPDKSQVNVNVSTDIGPIIPNKDTVQVPGVVISPEQSAQLSEMEKGFGGEMSEEELAKHFGQRKPAKAQKQVRLKELSKEDIDSLPVHQLEKLVAEAEEEELRQDNSNDIYKVKARVANLAVAIAGGNLTPVGTMMVNSFVHVVKDLYDFADTIPDIKIRSNLVDRIRKHESMPGNLIAAASSGVSEKSK